MPIGSIPETYRGNVSSTGPCSVYDEAKRFSEAMVMAFHYQIGVDVRLPRIFNTYGPRMRLRDGRAVPAFFQAARTGQPRPVHGDGAQTRSLCYVSDLVEGLLPRFLPRPTDDPSRRCPHATVAERELSWKARVPLSEGLAATASYLAWVH